MTLTDCQLLSIVAQLGTFAAAAERLHITPSAVSHAVHPHQKRRHADRRRRKAHARHPADARQQRVA